MAGRMGGVLLGHPQQESGARGAPLNPGIVPPPRPPQCPPPQGLLPQGLPQCGPCPVVCLGPRQSPALPRELLPACQPGHPQISTPEPPREPGRESSHPPIPSFLTRAGGAPRCHPLPTERRPTWCPPLTPTPSPQGALRKQVGPPPASGAPAIPQALSWDYLLRHPTLVGHAGRRLGAAPDFPSQGRTEHCPHPRFRGSSSAPDTGSQPCSLQKSQGKSPRPLAPLPARLTCDIGAHDGQRGQVWGAEGREPARVHLGHSVTPKQLILEEEANLQGRGEAVAQPRGAPVPSSLPPAIAPERSLQMP